MIKTKKDLKEYLQYEDKIYKGEKGGLQQFTISLHKYPRYYIRKYLKYLRYQEFYMNNDFYHSGNKLGFIYDLLYLYYTRKKNFLGSKIGIEIQPNCVGKGINIYHINGLVINQHALVGDNCIFHGSNCIGSSNRGVPTIGNGVEFGYGSCVIGDVCIADNIIIGAGAVVNKSFDKNGSTIAGIPAKEINN